MLRKIDLASMLYNLEVRVPFVDRKVSNFALPLPQDWKIKGGTRKRILWHLASRYFPTSILGPRAKHGFDIPIGEWFRRGNIPELNAILEPAKVKQGGIFSPDAVDRLVKEHMHGRLDHFEQLWTIFVLEHWRQRTNPIL